MKKNIILGGAILTIILGSIGMASETFSRPEIKVDDVLLAPTKMMNIPTRSESGSDPVYQTVNNLSRQELDLKTTPAKPGSRKIPARWKSLQAIQKDWIGVEKDKKGYLIYDPCCGTTNTISFKDGSLFIKWWMEDAYEFRYEKFTRVTGNKSFRMDAVQENLEMQTEIIATIYDNEEGLVLWQFGDHQWLMTPLENVQKFRHIKNNCPDYKRHEITFDKNYLLK